MARPRGGGRNPAKARNARAKRRIGNKRKAAAGTAANVQAANRRPICPICLKKMTGVRKVRTICDHVFHYVCFHRWLKYRLFCPVCEQNFRTELYHSGNAVVEGAYADGHVVLQSDGEQSNSG
ncbi:hypothetical protein niasHS_014320 [Heterodera schachtii]|uniref:RING-type domain-containing protein n=1 Tax=Heterodera schachtii TaxID=97005 RepID=A0ABD2IBG5_HETSC